MLNYGNSNKNKGKELWELMLNFHLKQLLNKEDNSNYKIINNNYFNQKVLWIKSLKITLLI